jgi:hypothetical protein
LLVVSWYGWLDAIVFNGGIVEFGVERITDRNIERRIVSSVLKPYGVHQVLTGIDVVSQNFPDLLSDLSLGSNEVLRASLVAKRLSLALRSRCCQCKKNGYGVAEV